MVDSPYTDTRRGPACIEDWSGDPDRGFYDRSEAVERVTAPIVATRGFRGNVICARAEAFFDHSTELLNEAITRL